MSQNNEVLVQFIGVEKTYDGEVLAVKNLNLEIHRGEFLTLLGPSGSGKTTTLLMLAGFETTTHGDILLKGKSITKVPPPKRNFGMVFQDYALFPHLTVLGNVAFGVPRGSQRDAQAHQALSLVGLTGFDRNAHRGAAVVEIPRIREDVVLGDQLSMR